MARQTRKGHYIGLSTDTKQYYKAQLRLMNVHKLHNQVLLVHGFYSINQEESSL